MRFDVVIGNPPYQISDGGNKSSAKPIYQLFYSEALKLNPQIIELITPARWYSGGKGLNEFRQIILTDPHIAKIIDYPNAKECFPGVSIGGGISIILRDEKKKDKLCEVVNVTNGTEDSSERELDEFPTFIRSNRSVEIIRKIQDFKEESLVQCLSSRNPFGLPTSIRGHDKKNNGDLTLYSSKGESYIQEDNFPEIKNKENIEKFKVMISRITSEHAGEPDKSGQYKVIAKMSVLAPGDVCTDSYIIGYPTDSRTEAQNFYNYLKTKSVRYLILQILSSINLAKETYRLVPMQDFSEDWSDSKLYIKYGLSPEEIELIKTNIKEME